jgi:predicted nucleic acid-binding protein
VIFLLDTNAINDVARQNPAMLLRLQQVQVPDQVLTCSIVRGETLFGIQQLPSGRRRDALEQVAMPVLNSFNSVAVPSEAAEHYANIKLECQRAGKALDENDLWIAATASLLDATLITRDADFQYVPRLRTEDWTK